MSIPSPSLRNNISGYGESVSESDVSSDFDDGAGTCFLVCIFF